MSDTEEPGIEEGGDSDSEDAYDGPSIQEVLWALPAFEEDLYLKMQATNLEMVDLYLQDLEAELLALYLEQERTPGPQAVFVSALSQLWIFGLYELLRTWRQRLRELLLFGEQVADLDLEASQAILEERKHDLESPHDPNPAALFTHEPFRRVAEDDGYKDRLQTALDASEILYRRLEALRVSLAKHEIPRKRGAVAYAPGYGRIDMLTGSITWFVALSEDEQDSVTRAAIADSIVMLGDDVSRYVFSPELQERVRKMPKWSYALKRTKVILADGRTFPGTLVHWNKQIIGVLGHDEIPFVANDVVEVEHDSEEPAGLKDADGSGQ